MLQSRMHKAFLITILLSLWSLGSSTGEAQGQQRREIVPYPRITVETVDYYTKSPRTSFCIGTSQIDIRLTNYTNESRYISLINRDTRGVSRTLYRGYLNPGTYYLSDLIDATFDIQGPPGEESIRLDVDRKYESEYSRWINFRVRYCDSQDDPGGRFWVKVSVNPWSIPQGGSGIVTVKTNASSKDSTRYYLEIYNSWNHLWRRIEAWKRPPGTYDLELAVSRSTPPGTLTYTVKLWSETRYGQRRLEASKTFTFRVVSDYYLSERFRTY